MLHLLFVRLPRHMSWASLRKYYTARMSRSHSNLERIQLRYTSLLIFIGARSVVHMFFFLLFCSNSKWDILDLICTYRQTKNRQIEKNMNSWEKRNIYTAKHKCLYRVRSFHLASGELLVLHFIAVALSGIDCFAHLIMLCVIHATSISRSSALHSIDCGTVWHSHIGARWGEHAQ